MTLHSAAVYFDELNNPAGYIIGSDSNFEFESTDPSKVIINGETEKAFFGSDFIGLAAGTFNVKKFEDVPSKIEELSDLFEGIENGMDFSDNDYLRRTEYSLLIARRRDEDTLDLLDVSNGADHKARLLHRINRNEPAKGLLLYGPFPEGYIKMIVGNPLDRTLATLVAKKFLSDASMYEKSLGTDYKPGPSHLYDIGFSGIRKI